MWGLVCNYKFRNPVKISLNILPKKDSLNDTPTDLPSTFYGSPIFVALII